jgi:hypothetical protein
LRHSNTPLISGVAITARTQGSSTGHIDAGVADRSTAAWDQHTGDPTQAGRRLHTADEALADTELINANIRQILDVTTLSWGVEVTLVELKDIQLPDSMKRAMARQAEAEREKRAKSPTAGARWGRNIPSVRGAAGLSISFRNGTTGPRSRTRSPRCRPR